MNYTAYQQYLDTFINHEAHLGQLRTSFKLERVQQLLEELNNPHKNLKVIHVAGSKGKGSICALTANILQKAGYKVGLYTSPHIDNYRERIRVLGSTENKSSDIFPDCITEEKLDTIIEEIKPAVERIRSASGDLSFFEVYTVLALYYFDKCSVDCAVLETGLGGRLDATNAVESMIAVIAPISLEHTQILGNTIEQIAEEKAGIIKDGRQKVVIAPQVGDALDVLKARCQEFGIKPFQVGSSVEFDNIHQDIHGQKFDLTLSESRYKQIELPLLGKHQRENVAVSVCAIHSLRDSGLTIPEKAVYDGCRDVFWPGRLEIVRRDPLILLDSAHNAVSAKILAETVKEVLGGKKVILVLGVSSDKDKDAIVGALQDIARKTVFTKADHPRASDLEGAVDVATALGLAQQEAGQDDVILVAGSVFVMSEARRHLFSKEPLCTN